MPATLPSVEDKASEEGVYGPIPTREKESKQIVLPGGMRRLHAGDKN